MVQNKPLSEIMDRWDIPNKRSVEAVDKWLEPHAMEVSVIRID